MHTLFLAIFGSFLLWYIFWPIEFILFLIVYACIASDSKPNKFWGTVWSFAIIAACWAHWRQIPSWQDILIFVAEYIIIGFLVSLYKYVGILYDFKKNAPHAIIKIKKDIEKETYGPGLSPQKVASELGLPYNAIEHDKISNSFRVNYKECGPIALWWIYWPVYILSVIFDPIERLITEFFKWIRNFYIGLANMFKVESGIMEKRDI